MWYCMPVIPKLRHLRQEDYEVKASLGYIARLSLTHTRRSNNNYKDYGHTDTGLGTRRHWEDRGVTHRQQGIR